MASPDASVTADLRVERVPGARTRAAWDRLKRWATSGAWFVAPLLLGVAAWELLAGATDTASVPSLGEIGSAWWELFERGEIVANVLRTLGLSAVALGLATFVGVVVGVAMARSAILGTGLRLYVDMLMSAPLVVFVPVFSALLGGETQVIVATAFVYCLFPILENTRLGTQGVSPDFVAMARSFGVSRLRMVARVLVPAALPLTMAGVRIAASKAFKGVLLGEILITVVGLGGRIRYYGSGFRIDYVYALTATTILVALFLVAAMRGIEMLLRRRFPSDASDMMMEA